MGNYVVQAAGVLHLQWARARHRLWVSGILSTMSSLYVTKAEVREAVEDLVKEGHLYTTIDDDHFESNLLGNGDMGTCSEQLIAIYHEQAGKSESPSTRTYT